MTQYFLPPRLLAGLDQPSAHTLDLAARRETDVLIHRCINQYNELLDQGDAAKARHLVLLSLDLDIYTRQQARATVCAHIRQTDAAEGTQSPISNPQYPISNPEVTQ